MATIWEIAFKATGLETITGLLKSKLATLATIAGAWQAAKAAFSSYLEEEKGLADLDSGLAKAGQASDEYRAKLVEIANEMERTAGLADDKFLSALGRLSREGMKPDQADGMAKALKNLAALMGGDVNQAAILLGRAMHGNFDVFSRMGIKVKDLDTLFQELEQRGGRLLEERMRTFGGQMENVRNAADDFGKSMVKSFAEVVAGASGVGDSTKYLERLAMGIRELGENVEESAAHMSDQFSTIRDAIANWADGKHWFEGRKQMEGTRAELKDVGQAAQDMAAEMEAAAAKTDMLNAALKQVNDSADEMIQRETARKNAELALQLAGIDRQEAEGKLGGPEADRARAEARATAKEKELDIQDLADKARREMLASALGENPDPTDPEAKKLMQEDRRIAERQGIRDIERRAAGEERAAIPIRFEKARDERDTKLNEQAERERQAKDRLAEKANKIADATPTVTEEDAIAVIQQAMGRRLRNEEVRFKKLNGEIKRTMDQLKNGRA